LVALFLATPAHSEERPWLERKDAMTKCATMRTITLNQIGEWNGKLWFASTDNHRDGYLNPSVVIDARQHVQDMIQEFDWIYSTKLRPAPDITAEQCKAHALSYATRIGVYVDKVLQQQTARPR
jgi:hypothetical protein